MTATSGAGIAVGAARERLEQLIAVLTGAADVASLAAACATPDVMSMATPELLGQLLPGLAGALGDEPDVEFTASDDTTAAAVITGGGMRLLIRAYVEPTGEHRLTDLDVVPFLASAGATEWTELQAAPVRRSHDTRDDARLTSWLGDVRERHHLVGVTGAVLKQGELAWSQGMGWSDLAAGEEMDADTGVFRIGSVSKTMTTVAVLQLV